MPAKFTRHLVIKISIILGLFFGPIFLLYKTVQADLLPTSVVVITVCGNGTIESGESCDDGANNGRYAYNVADRYCNSTCTGWASYCGDGILQSGQGEICDDGNNNSGDGCDAVCQTEGGGGGGGGGGGSPPPGETKVVLQGRAYPYSEVHILKDGKEIAGTFASSQADFSKEITNITAGVYTFSLWSEDKNEIKSITYSLTFRVSQNVITTVSGIFLPPTIGLDKSSLPRGDILNIFGQTVPEVEVDVHIGSQEIIEKVNSDEIGAWLLAFNTQPLEEGTHTAKSRFQFNSKDMSGFGKLLTFNIGKETVLFKDICSRADFNNDGRVNLVDFSIFLMWWGKNNSQFDLNDNGIVDLPDFSIFLTCWTG